MSLGLGFRVSSLRSGDCSLDHCYSRCCCGRDRNLNKLGAYRLPRGLQGIPASCDLVLGNTLLQPANPNRASDMGIRASGTPLSKSPLP